MQRRVRTANSRSPILKKADTASRQYVSAATTFRPSNGQHDVRQRGLPFPVTSGQAVRNLKLEMATTGAITGQIVDEDGQPIGHATVLALSEQYQKGEPRWYIERIIMTDERGNYRLFWLGPGRYKVAAVYENPQQRNMNMGAGGSAGTRRGTLPCDVSQSHSPDHAERRNR